MFSPQEHLTQYKGKDYLEVKWRLKWFREDHPHGKIETSLLNLDMERGLAIFHATVEDGDGGMASGHGSETVKDFNDFIEKAETKAIGRALAALGYGTQFAPELDEGERIVDAPVTRKASETPATRENNETSNHTAHPTQATSAPSGEVEQLLGEVKQLLYTHYQFKPEDQEPKWKTFKVHVLGLPVEDEGLSQVEIKRLREAIDRRIKQAKGAA